MKILILGSNHVAEALAQELCSAGHDITLIDNRVDAVKKIDMELDVRGIVGHPTYPEVLRQGECADSDALIAVLEHDESNMVACQIAHSLFNVPIKIARIRTHNYLEDGKLFGDDNLPIDLFINPERILAKKISQTINHPGAEEVQYHLEAGLARVIIPEASPWLGKPIHEIEKELDCRILIKLDNEQIIYLSGTDEVHAKDEVITACAVSNINAVLDHCGIENPSFSEIVIGGAGYNAKYLAKQLGNHYKIKVIEKNYHLCQKFAGDFPNVITLHGDVKDEQIWSQETLGDADIYCGLTNDDASNVLSCLIAKQLGCKKSLSLFKEPNYLELMRPYLDYGVSAQIAMVNTILTALYKKDGIKLVFTIANGLLMSASIVIKESFKHLGKPLKSIQLGNQICLIGVCRDNHLLLDQDTLIQEDDLIIFLTDSRQTIHDIKI